MSSRVRFSASVSIKAEAYGISIDRNPHSHIDFSARIANA
jgi:hypothetical protein